MTIEDGFVTYPNINGSLATWQFPSETLTAFAVATLTTIFAYQIAAILFDIFLGLKKPGEATAADISTLILTEDSSVSSVLANLNISRYISHWKFHGRPKKSRSRDNTVNPDESCNHDHTPSRIPGKVLSKFLILLAAAPLSNLLAVFLTIENDVSLTFEDVKFGGLAFGLNKDFSKAQAFFGGDICSAYDTRLSTLETAIAEVFICARATVVSGQVAPSQFGLRLLMSSGNGSAVVRVSEDSILLEAKLQSLLSTVVLHADIKSDGKVYRVKRKVDISSARQLFLRGVQAFVELCVSPRRNLTFAVEKEKVRETIDGENWRFEWDVECPYNVDNVQSVFLYNMTRFTLIEDDKFDVVDIFNGEGEIEDGGKIPFLIRRRSFITLGVLAIVVAVVVVLRIIVRVVTNNDVHLGIELVLKDTLRINRCDSMLQNDTRVDYSAQVYEGLDEGMLAFSTGSIRSDLSVEVR